MLIILLMNHHHQVDALTKNKNEQNQLTECHAISNMNNLINIQLKYIYKPGIMSRF